MLSDEEIVTFFTSECGALVHQKIVRDGVHNKHYGFFTFLRWDAFQKCLGTWASELFWLSSSALWTIAWRGFHPHPREVGGCAGLARNFGPSPARNFSVGLWRLARLYLFCPPNPNKQVLGPMLMWTPAQVLTGSFPETPCPHLFIPAPPPS